MIEGLLDPQALTFGFARRFATYKRATLLLRDPDRLAAILDDEERRLVEDLVHRQHLAQIEQAYLEEREQPGTPEATEEDVYPTIRSGRIQIDELQLGSLLIQHGINGGVVLNSDQLLALANHLIETGRQVNPEYLIK